MHRAVNKLEKQLRDYAFEDNPELLQLAHCGRSYCHINCRKAAFRNAQSATPSDPSGESP
jgi:hypothetical protein